MYKTKTYKPCCLLLYIILLTMLTTGCTYSLQSKVIAPDTQNNPTPPVVRINVGDDIQKTIDSSIDGSEIILSAGRYLINKPVEINNRKNITITGTGEVWVESKKTDHQIFLIQKSSNITLNNIKAQHISDRSKSNNSKPLDDNRKGSVVDVEDCKRVDFNNCELVGCGIYGIFSGNTDEINIVKCYLHHNSLKALFFYNKKGVTNVLIRNSRIINNADFIEKEGNINIDMSENNIIESNNMEGYKNR